MSDVAVSDCLRNASMRAARKAGMDAIDVRVTGPEPDLQTALARIREDGTQVLVAPEIPIIGVHAAQIAERALSQKLPALVALEQAGAGGLLSYGTALGQATHRMAGQACRLLEGRAATALPIETLGCPTLVVDMCAASRLGLTVPPEVLRSAARIIQQLKVSRAGDSDGRVSEASAGQPNGETISRGRDTFLKPNRSTLFALDRMGIWSCGHSSKFFIATIASPACKRCGSSIRRTSHGQHENIPSRRLRS